MKPTLTRRDFTYNYRPDPLMSTSQKVKRFFARRKPLFWACIGCMGYIALTALMQALDARGGAL